MNQRTLTMGLKTFTFLLGSLLFVCGGSLGTVSASGYDADAHHGGSSHHKSDVHKDSHHGSSTSGHEMGHHGKGGKGHGSSHSGMTGHAGHGNKHGGGAHQNASHFIKHVLKFKEGMAITESQAQQLNGINANFKRTKIQTEADVKLANLDLHELLKNEQADLSAIESKLKKVHMLKADLYMASIKAKREAKAVLTDEQRKRMKAVHDRIKAYGSKMKQSGHPGGYPHHSKEKEKS
ncbi:MAG: hypothetical protein GKS05_04145 [Nitrospirales bacterium]|nr:hypothetical protein [Nitrospirales bacterium]